jgi:hypothetical protein
MPVEQGQDGAAGLAEQGRSNCRVFLICTHSGFIRTHYGVNRQALFSSLGPA